MAEMSKLPKLFKLVPRKLLSESSTQHLHLARIFNFILLRLKTDLIQAEVDITPERYINMALFTSIYFFIIMGLSSLAVLFLVKSLVYIPVALIIVFVFSLFMFSYIISYPRLYCIRRIRELEKFLLTALRHIAIKVRSGVPLFQTLVSLSEGYGELSKEIKSLVEKVNAGVSLDSALEETAAKNPSVYFRRALLQISTTIKSGADLNNTLTSLIQFLSQSIATTAKKYGRELNFWSVFYLVISIIFPAVGITFFVMISTYIGINLSFYIFVAIGIVFTVLQFFFLGMMNSRRPSLVIY
jgi:flagellar protein FlaJ